MSTPAWILWLEATLLPLGALWLLWQLALRQERSYRYNRALLLLAPLLAAALPLLPRPELPAWPDWLAGPAAGAAPAVGPLLATVEPGSPAGVAAWPGWLWLLGLYLGGVAVGLSRLVWQAGRLWRRARQLPRFEQPGYALVHTGGRQPTGSFGRVVFWDETAALTPAEARAVLHHELAHVGQRHTLDLLWLHLWRAVLWPNPFVHLLLPALRLTHELLADQQAAAETGTAYAPLLAGLAARRLLTPAPAALLHPFTFSFTLTRLAMLKDLTPVRRWKQWLALPLLAAACCIVGRPAHAQVAPSAPIALEPGSKAWLDLIARKRRLAQHQDSLRGPFASETVQQVQITNMQGPGEPQVAVVRISRLEAVGGRVVAQEQPAVYTYVEQMPTLPGTQGSDNRPIVEAIRKNLAYPAGGTRQGKVFVKFIVQPDGAVTNVEVVQGLADAYDRAVVDAVRQLPRFVPGRQAGKPAAVSFTVPILFAGKP